MEESYTIFDPKDKPFGCLSNNYKHPMKLDDKYWNTVTNYIYANMLTDPMNIEMVRKISKGKEIKSTFVDLSIIERNDITMKSM